MHAYRYIWYGVCSNQSINRQVFNARPKTQPHSTTSVLQFSEDWQAKLSTSTPQTMSMLAWGSSIAHTLLSLAGSAALLGLLASTLASQIAFILQQALAKQPHEADNATR